MKGRKPKLTVADCEEIRRMYHPDTKPPWKIIQIAKVFGVCAGTINRVLERKYKPREDEASK